MYGPDCFEFQVLKEFPPAEVHEREREAIAALRPELNVYGLRARCTARAYLVGDEMLSVLEIARRAGVGTEAIRARIAQGLVGRDLLKSKYKGPRKPYARQA